MWFRNFFGILFTLVLISESTVLGVVDFSEIFENVKSDANEETQTKAALNVIARILPDHFEYFEVVVDFYMPRNTFRLQKNDSLETVFITASSGVVACKAFYHYLKYYCNCHVSWEGSQLQLPDTLPSVYTEETSPSWFIYYQNVCTWSYSFAWWIWPDWQKHIDWMALNGITLTLAPVQEMVWTRVYEEIGLTKDEIDDHFAGPGFFAWQRMGNMRGWGGPLTSEFKQTSSDIQQKVIQSLRDLGIAVALPAFAGHVPVAFNRLFPNASMTPAQKWNNFPDKYCCPLFIDPLDPLFRIVGEIFLKNVISEYGGTNHIYFSDPFNEIQPKSSDANYLASASHGIYETMKAVDEQAVWLLQGWMFVKNPFWKDNLLKSFLTAVPLGRMLVLDLQSEVYPQYERTNSFYGQPYIWCMLHNFGGTLGMHGSIDVVNTKIVEAHKMKNSTLYGVGITPEGINQNYVMYEFALERGWDQSTVIVDKWIDHYILARYGEENENIQAAWHELRRSVYSYEGTEAIRGKYIVCRRPSFKLNPSAWYNYSIVENSWKYFLRASNIFQNSELYKHDLVDVTRQFLQNKIESLYVDLISTYQKGNRSLFLVFTRQFVDALVDMNRILKTNRNFLLGNWLNSAKDLASNDVEADLFEINARNQITIWGPNGQIVDYAMKQWAGIVGDYCLPRWELFFKMCEKSLETNKRRFNMTEFRIRVFRDIEHPFTVDNQIYPDEPEGDAIEISKELFAKWSLNNEK